VGLELVHDRSPTLFVIGLLAPLRESFVSQYDLRRTSKIAELESDQAVFRGMVAVPAPRVYDPTGRIDFAIDAAHPVLVSTRLAHVDPVLAALAEVDLSERHGQGTRRVPAFQFFRLRPRVLHVV
jgi:hypothetical protein